jgi:serine/threonine protein kinase
MKKIFKKYFDFENLNYCIGDGDSNHDGIKLLNSSSTPANSSSTPPSSSNSSSTPSPLSSTIEKQNSKDENINIEMHSHPTFNIDEIVNSIIRSLQEAELYQLTYWDKMSTFMLKNTITNIHIENHKEYVKDLIIFKQYQDETCKTNLVKYGIFKHKYFNLVIRIDWVNDQISGEETITSILMQKYENKYQDIIRIGIVLPIYCHIKMSSPELFYSVQPFITNAVTFDKWIHLNKTKNNFDEVIYDVFIQLSGILKELHDVECVHGDIKPGNILIVQKQTHVSVFLIDFGLSGIHEKTTNASGGTIPFCAPETHNTIANTKNGNDAIKCPQYFEYNWIKHNKSHDIWSLGLLIINSYLFKHIKLYYHEYPFDFFLPSGYVSQKYLDMVKHEYIREMFSEHILVEPSKRCDIYKLNELLSNMAFM